MLVDRFRPASGALALDGDAQPRPLLVARLHLGEPLPELRRVPELQRGPLPGARAAGAPGTTGEALRDERPLLLEPRHDDPEQHLVYSEDGSVA